MGDAPLPQHGSPTTFNLETVLHTNINNSMYFKSLQTYEFSDLVDEIYNEARPALRTALRCVSPLRRADASRTHTRAGDARGAVDVRQRARAVHRVLHPGSHVHDEAHSAPSAHAAAARRLALHPRGAWRGVIAAASAPGGCLRVFETPTLEMLSAHADALCTRHQVGFLYLRYVGEPRSLWSWFEEFLNDREARTHATQTRALSLPC
jgi:hypothetical protein